MKKIEELNEDEAIFCATEEEYWAICKILHDMGKTWADGRSYLELNCWNDFGICLYTKEGLYDSKEWAIQHSDIIYPAKDFLQETDVVKDAIKDIIKEWHDSNMQTPLIKILRSRL